MTPVELAVDTYIRAAKEPDADTRMTILRSCWAEDGRFVTRNGELRGLSAMNAMLGRFHADLDNISIRVTAIDARGKSFRFKAVTERRDGTQLDVFDAGEIDADGRITLILTFAGPL